jgi:DNA-binding IclR family transcriptional regulator
MQRSSLSPDETAGLRLATRVLAIIETVALSDVPLGVMAIATAADIDKSSVSRVMKVLVDHAWVEKQPAGYIIGERFSYIASKANVDDFAGRLAARELNVLARATGETVSFHRLVGAQRICVMGIESPEIMRCRIPLHETIPLHHGTSGKVILTWVSEELRAKVLEGVRSSDLPNVRHQLAAAKQSGFLSTEHDPNQGVGALAVPVFGPLGVIGSLGVIGPVERWGAGQRLANARTALECAARMAKELGAPSDPFTAWRDALDLELVSG